MSGAQRIERISENITLYQGDSREIVPTLKNVDAIVTDPPYGIGAGKMSFGKWRTSRMVKQDWDDHAPNLEFLLSLEVPTIVWGGNYFDLPPSRAFLVWNKGGGFKGRDFAECELAWCSFDANARVFDFDPLAKGAYKDKVHPTQKPIPLMFWCLQQIKGNPKLILDPYMGSGTTGVAAARLKRGFVGIELDPAHFDSSCRRISEELNKPDLFASPTPTPSTQTALF